jgi:hypothetical protein
MFRKRLERHEQICLFNPANETEGELRSATP